MTGIHRLTARGIAAAKSPGFYADGDGLYLQVTMGALGTVKRSWLVRYTLNGRRREMGLGPVSLVSLSEARDAAHDVRKRVRAGEDPIEARRAERAKALAASAKAMSFQDCANAYIDAHKSGWKNAKHSEQWRATLEAYAYPVFGARPVSDVDAAQVMRVLDPIWTEKNETARRVRGRIESILDWAQVRGLRKGENPARWKGHLEKALPTIKKSLRVKHHPALPFAQMPAFMAKLSQTPGVSAQALGFCVLTATRTNETLGARWSEFDLTAKVWTIPAARIKAAREHRVPLSEAALAILRQRGVPARSNDHVFSGMRADSALSNTALLMTLKRIGYDAVTTHGFRSSFRDWAAEGTDFPSEVAEAALAHTIGNQVEAAYRRGDLFDKRRQMMEAWARHCAPMLVAARNP